MPDHPAPPSPEVGIRRVTARRPARAAETDPARWFWRCVLSAGAVALALLVCGFALHQLDSVDFWWQLRLGQYITELREVPTTDPLSFTAQGNPYVDSHWLFQVALWRTYLVGGINGTLLTVAGVALLAWLCVWLTMEWREAAGVALLAVALGAAAASERYLPRPDLLSLLFLALTGFIVARYRRTGGAIILLLPVLHLVWVNTHGLWILGPIVIGAHALGDALVSRLPVPAGWNYDAMAPAWCKRLGRVLLVMVPVTLLTPQPLTQALYPLTLFREIQSGTDWVASSVTELGAPLADAHWPVATVAFVALACLTVLGFAVRARRLDPVGFVLVCAFGYLALTARRNMALFAVVAVPFAVRAWADGPAATGAAWLESLTRRAQPVLAVLAVWIAMAGAWGAATNTFATRDGTLTRFGLGLSATHHPGRVGDFIAATHAPGPIWNTPELGGYLAWRFWPERPVYIDGRWEVYGQLFLERYGRTIRDPVAWEEAAAQDGVRAAVVFHRMPDYGLLLRHLYRSDRWVLCYVDAVAALFVQRTPEAAPYLAAHAVRLTAAALPTPLPASPVVVWEDGYRDRPHFATLEAGLRRWPPRPGDGSAAALVANFCFVLKEDAAAAEWFTRALAAEPDNYAAHVSLAYLAERGGDLAAARAHARAAARARPWAAGAQPAPVE